MLYFFHSFSLIFLCFLYRSCSFQMSFSGKIRAGIWLLCFSRSGHDSNFGLGSLIWKVMISRFAVLICVLAIKDEGF